MASKEAKKAMDADDVVTRVINLNYDGKVVGAFYDDWASNYEAHMAQMNFTAPAFMADFLTLITHKQAKADLRLLDVGCGTGLLGRALKAKGFESLDGFDLSAEMAEVAGAAGVYGDVRGGVDLNGPVDHVPERTYDAALACGVFTSGHVLPSRLTEVFRLVKVDGVVVVNVRLSYTATQNFDDLVKAWEQEGKIKVAGLIRNGPYHDQEPANYWALTVL